jgi:hypothetical protein
MHRDRRNSSPAAVSNMNTMDELMYMHQTELERPDHDQWRAGLRYLAEIERGADLRGEAELASTCSTAAMWLRSDRSRTAANHFKRAWGALRRALGGGW